MRAATTRLPQPLFDEPVFREDQDIPDPTGFQQPHPSDAATYAAVKDLLAKDVVAFPKSRLGDDKVCTLAQAYGARGKDVEDTITKNGQIVFHVLGDSGVTTAGKRYRNELQVTDQVAEDANTSDAVNRPAFAYHLGDVVYDFGEPEYYYDQFYDPFRNYPAPVFAIPGNHDSFVVPGTPEAKRPLAVFMRNFCAEQPQITQDARSLHRTAMTQPGVYFSLDAPFVRIIGLFSNALEDPGVISSHTGGQHPTDTPWPDVPDHQIAFLRTQLKKIKKDDYQGAVILAVHHPPFAYFPPQAGSGGGGNHGCSLAMLREIDSICKDVGVYPHAFLSGHAHNYQRYTRKVRWDGKSFDVPFLICGDSGHNVLTVTQSKGGGPGKEPGFNCKVDYLDANPVVDARGLTLEKYNDHDYGYLRVTANPKHVSIGFHQVGATNLQQSRFDMVTIDLKTHRKVAN